MWLRAEVSAPFPFGATSAADAGDHSTLGTVKRGRPHLQARRARERALRAAKRFALPDLPHARKKHINNWHGTRVEDGPERVLLVSDVESTLNIIGKQQDIQGVRARAVMLALHHSYPYCCTAG